MSAERRLAIAAVCGLALLAAGLVPGAALAHDFSAGVLSLVETAPGSFEVAWTAPVDSRRREDETVRVVFEGGCRRSSGEEAARLECGGEGLRGAVAFHGAVDARTRIVVAIRELDGDTREAIVTGDSPRLELERDAGPSTYGWVALGVEHILGGLDHLAFLAGLLLLLGGLDRRIVVTITAFTLAHSVTLALAALDVLRLPVAPVEASIAASIVLVAREAVRDGAPTLARRAPWTIALVFGLVHGLGFAGALRDVGLPEGSVLPALVGFNVGVELGQLAIVAIAVLAARAARARIEAAPWVRRAACYALGSLGAYWLVARTVAIVAGAS